MIRHLLLTLALAAGVSSAAQAQVADVVQVCGASSGVVSPVGTGGRLTRDVNGSLCVAGISGGSGGGGASGTVTQGPAAIDTSANRWPVLAYQGGTWSFGLSGPIPAGSNVIGAVSQSGGPWTVSGTVTAAQGGTWTVAQGAAGSTAWKVDGSGVTQPVSAAALPLPAGAATAALQSNVQSAVGTAATTLLGVQGSASGVPVPVSSATLASAANQNSTAAGTSATNAQGVQGVTGGVPVNIQGGNTTAVKTDGSGVTQPVSGTVATSNGALDSTVQARLGTLGQKAAAGSTPVVIASDQTSFPVTSSTLNRALWLTPPSFNAALAANGTVTGLERDLGASSPAQYATYRVFVRSDQAGTLTIYGKQTPGGGLVAMQSLAVAANTPVTVSQPVLFRIMQTAFVLGGTAATSVTVADGYTSN